jgi:hypothetical protein
MSENMDVLSPRGSKKYQLGGNLQTSDGTLAKKKNCALARGLFHDPDASLGSIAIDRLLSVADSWLLYFLAYKAAFLSRIFLSSLTIFQKNNASYSGILLAQVTCPEAIEISREVLYGR